MSSSTTYFSLETEDDVSVIIGECPTCHAKDRSLVAMNYYRNTLLPLKSQVNLTCLRCFTQYTTQIIYIKPKK